MPDLRAWTQSLELPAERQDRLLGVLKAAEACGRIRALRLRYNHLRVRPGAQREGRAGENWGAGREGRPARDPEERGLEDPRGLAAGAEEQGNTSRWLRGTPRATPRPAGGGDLAPHPAAEVRARRHPAGAVPASAAEAHEDPGPPGPSRGACQPGKAGREGPARLSTHLAPAPLPRSGGAWRPSWRRQWMATSSRVDGYPTCPHKVLILQEPADLYAPSPRPRAEKEGMDAASPT